MAPKKSGAMLCQAPEKEVLYTEDRQSQKTHRKSLVFQKEATPEKASGVDSLCRQEMKAPEKSGAKGPEKRILYVAQAGT